MCFYFQLDFYVQVGDRAQQLMVKRRWAAGGPTNSILRGWNIVPLCILQYSKRRFCFWKKKVRRHVTGAGMTRYVCGEKKMSGKERLVFLVEFVNEHQCSCAWAISQSLPFHAWVLLSFQNASCVDPRHLPTRKIKAAAIDCWVPVELIFYLLLVRAALPRLRPCNIFWSLLWIAWYEANRVICKSVRLYIKLAAFNSRCCHWRVCPILSFYPQKSVL